VARGAILIGNDVSPLWEWLPAKIIAVRRGGLPQKNIQLHWMPNPADGGVAIENRFRGFRAFCS